MTIPVNGVLRKKKKGSTLISCSLRDVSDNIQLAPLPKDGDLIDVASTFATQEHVRN